MYSYTEKTTIKPVRYWQWYYGDGWALHSDLAYRHKPDLTGHKMATNRCDWAIDSYSLIPFYRLRTRGNMASLGNGLWIFYGWWAVKYLRFRKFILFIIFWWNTVHFKILPSWDDSFMDSTFRRLDRLWSSLYNGSPSRYSIIWTSRPDVSYECLRCYTGSDL